MYGLLLDIICEAIKNQYGADKMEQIRQMAGISQIEFCTTKVYSESLMPRITRTAATVTGSTPSQIMELFGSSFVKYLDHYGYDLLLKVLGRDMRDFLNGLDNLHEYLRFTYPNLKPPSFFCESESKLGLTLHYRSRRKGFLCYVIGQIKSVGMRFYNTAVEVEILKEEVTDDMTHVIMRLHFDNRAYEMSVTDEETIRMDNLHLDSKVFFDVFPFHIVFNRQMTIQNVGSGLATVGGDMVGCAIDQVFTLTRPLIEFNLHNVLMYNNNVFELTTINASRNDKSTKQKAGERDKRDQTVLQQKLCLKGQMMYIPEWQAVIYMATPIMENLDRMFETGLYINDLSMHDSSRDLVLAATQQSSELKLALDQEKHKSQILEESMVKLDEEMERTDSLLYQMIPKTVADRLRNGEPASSTCQVFNSVTILFSDVVGFTRICSQMAPMMVVSMLNTMYTQFDRLSEKHDVYKVETIGDAYMVVSGAPTVTNQHAERACHMALDMMAAMTTLTEPSSGKHMQIRVGLHSGTVVAGVVGHKMPRYCLFGETVNTASLMENNGKAMGINMSEATKGLLNTDFYRVCYHGSIHIKLDCSMKMYWLEKALSDPPPTSSADRDLSRKDPNATD